ncbi:hypothetical protein DFH08DRAFT_836562 [Mycena albidolilacea]|uniref:Uncharacterized protein n=1 Tax=Mycena albidolilacea TaxID=1033008 RepID=A0AAD7ATA1_9AGAR|nr:hypothetical protein DFH08DRAFT_836562 [Mycena albidolilacea]
MSRLTILCLFMLFSVILAAPLDSRTVFAPPITSPTEQSVWKVGQTQTVTWDATGIPAGVMGKIQLGYLDPNSPGEHLSTILATGFNLTDEKVRITVPPVVTRSSYIVVLFGDSGNISPQFTIQGSSSSSASPSSASTSGSGVASSPASTPTGPVGSPSLSLTVTPSPPIATGSSGFSAPLSTPTAPLSPSSAPSAPVSSSSSLPASSAAAVTTSGIPSPSPSPNAGWSMNEFKTYQVMITPALALLLFI